MKKLFKHLILFLTFGTVYFCIECLWKRGLTHWSMFVLAGIVGMLIGGINERIPWTMPFFRQCTIGMIIAVIGEFITGLIVNVWLHLNIWHYSFWPFLWGQCSIPFALVWFGLAGICIIMDDWLRWKWFGEEVPYYIWRW